LKEKKWLPCVEKVLKYYLGICMSLALGLTAGFIRRLAMSMFWTVVKRSDSLLLFIYSSTRRRDNYKSQPYIYFDYFVFRILLVQSVINLENIGQKTLEKTDGEVDLKKNNLNIN
jgi:hypothetical protein